MLIYIKIITFGISTEYFTFSNVRESDVNGRSIFCFLYLSTLESMNGLVSMSEKIKFKPAGTLEAN